jgi:transcriptional regulator with XRE-family HTH domain
MDNELFVVHYMRRIVKSIATDTLPRPAKKALIKLGEDIAVARKKRRISTISMAERAFISRSTLYKVERGDPTVAMGTYATIISLLGQAEALGDVVDRRNDSLGLDIDEDRLPVNIAPKRK